MIKFASTYLKKNLFYISVMITGFTSLLMGIFYGILKSKLFETVSSNFLDGTGVLGAYVTVSSSKPSGVNYFLIVFLLGLGLFFLITFVLKIYLKKRYLEVFNLFGILNIILIFSFILGIIFINVSLLLSFILIIIGIICYLFFLYRCLIFIFKLDIKKSIISLIIFLIPILIILVILKLFV